MVGHGWCWRVWGWWVCWPSLLAVGGLPLVGDGWSSSCSGLCVEVWRWSWAQVDPSQTTRSKKGGKMRRAQNTVKRGSFGGGLGATWAHVGAILAHLAAMWAHFGAMWAHLGAMWAQFGARLAHLGAMLAHLNAYVGPSRGLSWPMLTHLKPPDPKKAEKCGEHKTP